MAVMPEASTKAKASRPASNDMTSSSSSTRNHRSKATVAKRASPTIVKGHSRSATDRKKVLSRSDLIKGTDHIHFHENIRIQPKKKKGSKDKEGNEDDKPDVVKMETGTLYIFRGSQRRVVFVRNK
eukprot:CAMPEP_0172458626 /NCGR_PEP_ID=MMETSP1065-20121228/28440_1 /TAXON_ID=265537 /ORGANISM="Amphiprora paludosa, Strain CCMP125" /LENGTH=125 /DNA_ID=CAMNT_0013212971 /DNA_START=167 /DNA_END=544 /DNA_ORIENTATION=+